MKTALLTKNKSGFIDGSIRKSADPADHSFWERCNGMVISWLRNSTVPKIRLSLMYVESAAQI